MWKSFGDEFGWTFQDYTVSEQYFVDHPCKNDSEYSLYLYSDEEVRC